MHFNLQSFMETLQTLDLEHSKVKLRKEREILDEVMKVVESERVVELEHAYTNCVTTSRKLYENEQ